MKKAASQNPHQSKRSGKLSFFFEGPLACKHQGESGALGMWGRKGCPEF